VTSQAVRYTAVSLLIAAVIAGIGVVLGGGAYRSGVLAGAALGFITQVAVFWIFVVWLFPGRGWHAYGLGLLVRLAVFALAAFVLVPVAGLPLGATLFSLVGVFWISTLIEPLFLKTRTSNPTQA
jgi:hypothetical protein